LKICILFIDSFFLIIWFLYMKMKISIIIFFSSVSILYKWNLKIHMWTMYLCTCHVLHLVTFCSHFQFWIHCSEFSWNSLQNEWNVDWIGPVIFSWRKIAKWRHCLKFSTKILLFLKTNSPNFAPFGVRGGLSPQGCLLEWTCTKVSPVNAKSD
jgi:hypothetical protein